MTEALPINPTQLTGLLAFGCAAAACAVAAHRRRAARWWWLAGVSAACLIEVALGLRHRAHDLVGSVLQAGGWYESRAHTQVLLLAALGLMALATLVWLSRLRGAAAEVGVASVASVTALWMFAIEAVSLHAVDALMYARIGPVLAIGWVWAALALVIAAAALRAAKVSRESVPAPRR